MSKILLLLMTCTLLSCGQKNSGETISPEPAITSTKAATPDFNADSAYTFVANQVAFGPRVPNTQAHRDCGNYLENELRRFGATIHIQEMELKAYNNTRLQAKNIIGSYNPEQTRRILLFAHWDSRPYADHDPDKNNHRKPIDGADDGASGVGVLLEIARQLNLNKTDAGIDIIFFDAEDYGIPTFSNSYAENTWCLGSQYWAKKPHIPNYKADFGILLDMVGSRNATFYKEKTSIRFAAPYVEKVWNTAINLGYGKYFINAPGGYITDDHEYVIKGRNIPCIDIINYDPDQSTGFGSYWHTMADTMDLIDKRTLNAVGHTVMEVIYTY